MSTRISLPIGLRNLVPKDGSRYAIQSADVRPEPDSDGSALVSVTDGRALIVRATDHHELGGPVLVPRDSLPTGKVETLVERDGDGDRFTIQPKSGTKRGQITGVAICPATGSAGQCFPPIIDVIPDPSQYRPVCRISADLLHKVAQAISTDPETSSTRGLTILCHEDVDHSIRKPVIVLGDSDTIGVVMPIAIESTASGSTPGITDRLRERVESMRKRIRRAFQTPEERERADKNRREREAAEVAAREAA